MNAAAQLPASGFLDADHFLDAVIAALAATDAAALRRLESAAPRVAAPGNRAQYFRKRATFAALLDATARNLRFLRRVTGKNAPVLYGNRRD